MLNFKEYTLMSFQNLFEERFKNHFLKEAGQNLFKFNFSASFLSSLTEDGNNKAAINYFVNLIDTEKIYADLFNSFLSDSSNKNYYRFACYYMKENNLPSGISPLNSNLTKGQNADIALKEIFANELYKHLSILTLSKPQPEQKDIIQQTKENIDKTFVPDAIVVNNVPVPAYLLGNSFSFDEVFPLHFAGFNIAPTQFIDAAKAFQESSYYNDRTISFKDSIYNQQKLEDRINLFQSGQLQGPPLGSNAVKEIIESSVQNVNYSDLLSKGAYIEYYFKFNYDLLLKYTPFGTPDGNESNDLSFYELKGLSKKNYYSFREASLLLHFLKVISTGFTLDLVNFPQVKSLLLTKQQILDDINLKFGARLVVNAPFLNNFTTNNIKPINTNESYNDFQAVITAASSYSEKNFKSAYDNKTFVYNLIERITPSGDEVSQVSQFETFPLAEYEISLPNENVQGSTVLSILAKLDITPNSDPSYIRYFYDNIVDEEIVAKFSKEVLDGLFNIQIVKEYFLSKTNSLEAISAASLGNDEIYNEATKGTILSSGSTPEEFINDANKMDDIIDQNLITLINSIEVS
jgi:hypothetical protein